MIPRNKRSVSVELKVSNKNQHLHRSAVPPAWRKRKPGKRRPHADKLLGQGRMKALLSVPQLLFIILGGWEQSEMSDMERAGLLGQQERSPRDHKDATLIYLIYNLVYIHIDFSSSCLHWLIIPGFWPRGDYRLFPAHFLATTRIYMWDL